MASYLVRIPRSVEKRLNKIPLPIQNRLFAALDKLSQDPSLGFKLKGKLAKYHKYRVGDYRILYAFDTKTKTIEILAIEHRQGVYK